MSAAAGRVEFEGQRCGCKAGRVRLISNFSFPRPRTILVWDEGLGPLVGLGFFSESPPPSKLVGLYKGCWAVKDLSGELRAVTGTGVQARIELID